MQKNCGIHGAKNAANILLSSSGGVVENSLRIWVFLKKNAEERHDAANEKNILGLFQLRSIGPPNTVNNVVCGNDGVCDNHHWIICGIRLAKCDCGLDHWHFH